MNDSSPTTDAHPLVRKSPATVIVFGTLNLIASIEAATLGLAKHCRTARFTTDRCRGPRLAAKNLVQSFCISCCLEHSNGL